MARPNLHDEKMVKGTMTMTPTMIERIDRVARQARRTRSDMIRIMVEDFMQRE